MKKRIMMLLCGLALALTICACGAKDSAQNEEETEEVSEDKDEDKDKDKDKKEKKEPKELSPEKAQAACEHILEDISFWEYEYLYNYHQYEGGASVDFKTDKSERARLAALITDLGAIDEDTWIVVLDNDDVNENAKKIFNKKIRCEDLYDDDDLVTKYDDNGEIKAARLINFYDDEGDFIVYSQDFAEEDGVYEVTQGLYCGYWGNNYGHPNYEVKFHFIQDDESYYGVVLNDMSFGAVDYVESNEYDPFYGIWIAGVKDEADANRIAEEAMDKGLPATVYVTSDWSNLNSDRWYVVAAYISFFEDETDMLLQAAKDAGYSDAYVKYSGDYIGY